MTHVDTETDEENKEGGLPDKKYMRCLKIKFNWASRVFIA